MRRRSDPEKVFLQKHAKPRSKQDTRQTHLVKRRNDLRLLATPAAARSFSRLAVRAPSTSPNQLSRQDARVSRRECETFRSHDSPQTLLARRAGLFRHDTPAWRRNVAAFPVCCPRSFSFYSSPCPFFSFLCVPSVFSLSLW